ncbi:hypothetical protein [Candidatus Palauibacter sp.]|uniref:hypothetical protein n=1 Tax=Candidatus Palauibacter sp. TaxID=3101350 RepID=UPI003AF2488C
MLRRHSPAVAAALLVLAVSLATACGDEATAPPPEAPNQRPVPTNEIPAQELAVGETLTVDAAAYFSDPDGDALAFDAESSNAGVVSVSLSGSAVTAVGVAPGEAQVTIRARDPLGQQARHTFNVLVPVPRTADHAALEAIYAALGGPDWLQSENWLSGHPLDNWHGVEVDGDGRVVGLDLEFNGLEGTLPPQLGDLPRLRSLRLSRNAVSGGIPPELGHLPDFERLELRENELGGTIPPHVGDFTNLYRLELGGNAFAGAIPPEIGRLTRLELLDLGDNQLTGAIPPELGNFAGLQTLLVHSNDLTGPVPVEFGRLARLRTLNLSGNAELSGPLPLEMTAITGLAGLHLGGSALCAPADPIFAAWLNRIRRHHVATCADEGSSILLTQAVQSMAFPVPLVAGDSALLRVFLTAPEGTSVDFPPVRARFFVEDAESYVVEIPAQSNPVPTEIDEGSLASSVNALIPGWVVQPGLEVVVETDPEGTLDPALGLTRRIPDAGRRAVDVRAMPTFDLTVIPFLVSSDTDRSIVSLVESLTPDHELLWYTRTLLPVGDFTVTAHEPVMTSTNNQSALLGETNAIRVAEGGTGHYMGTAAASDGGGLAYLGGFSSFADMRIDIIAHELGHNMSLSHAPCSAYGVDPWYPEPDGRIRAWGYDFRDGGALVAPDTPDIMGYCDPHWIGDYHFSNAMRHRLATERTAAADGTGTQASDWTAAIPNRTLLLWGGVDETGAPYLEPTFVLDAPPTLPLAVGEYVIRGRSAGGEELFSLPFDMPRIVHGDGGSSFAFALPVRAEWAGTLSSLTLSGPGGSATLDAATDRPAAIVRDPRTGVIRAILRDLSPATLARGIAEELSLDPGLEVQVSRGIPGPAAWNR